MRARISGPRFDDERLASVTVADRQCKKRPEHTSRDQFSRRDSNMRSIVATVPTSPQNCDLSYLLPLNSYSGMSIWFSPEKEKNLCEYTSLFACKFFLKGFHGVWEFDAMFYFSAKYYCQLQLPPFHRVICPCTYRRRATSSIKLGKFNQKLRPILSIYSVQTLPELAKWSMRIV